MFCNSNVYSVRRLTVRLVLSCVIAFCGVLPAKAAVLNAPCPDQVGKTALDTDNGFEILGCFPDGGAKKWLRGRTSVVDLYHMPVCTQTNPGPGAALTFINGRFECITVLAGLSPINGMCGVTPGTCSKGTATPISITGSWQCVGSGQRHIDAMCGVVASGCTPGVTWSQIGPNKQSGMCNACTITPTTQPLICDATGTFIPHGSPYVPSGTTGIVYNLCPDLVSDYWNCATP
jgi:hypothetical protein